MSRDRYSDKHIIEGIGSSTEIGIDSPKITLTSGGGLSSSGDSYLGYISVEGSANFDEPVGFNDSLYTIGNTTKIASPNIYIGENSGDGTAEVIRISPKDGVDGSPVVIDGNLDITGSLDVTGTITGAISGTDVSYSGDFNVDVDGDINIERNSDQKLRFSESSIQLNGGSWGNGITLHSGGRLQIHASREWATGSTEEAETYSEFSRLYMGYPDAAAFSFLASKEGDAGEGPFRYIVDVINGGDAAGNHRCMRLSLHGDGSDADSEATSLTSSWGAPSASPGGDSEHQDYFLVCSDEVTGIYESGSMQFFIDGSGNIGITFTGQHWVVYESGADENIGSNSYIGMIAYSSGEIFNNPKIDEALPVVKMCDTDMDARVYGVITKIPRLSYSMKQFFEFKKPYNESCRGDDKSGKLSYSDDSPYYKARVNSVGEGQVWVTNYNGEVSNGDYITSSAIAGYGMRQDDDILHSYTVAKCVEEIDWGSIDSTVSHDGTEYKKYLAACTYHCG